MSYDTLCRYIRYYKKDNTLQPVEYEGNRMGRAPLVSKSKLAILNDKVLKNSGKVDTVRDLSDDIVALHNREKQAQGHVNIMDSSTPSPATLKKYTTYAVSLTPSLNITQNPTSEWELRYYG